MASRPETWPTYPDELLPNALFKLAAQYPDLTYSEYPRSKDVADGYMKITYKEVANAVHAVAWWIEQNVGKPAVDDGSETLVYMGPSDLRYSVLVLGSVMVGYKMLFPTPRYGAESITRLIASVDGSVMLVPSETSPVVSEILAKRPMRRFDFPSVDHLIASTPAPYKWTKTFESHKLEPLVCLHTSGTTGFPKPIIWTHDWANSVVQGDGLPGPAGYERPERIFQVPRARTMHLFPPMHASGIITALFFQLGCGSVIVHAPSRMMPNEAVDVAVNALEALGDDEKVDVFGLPPPHAEYLAANKPLLERVGKVVKTILWAGGSISEAAGKALSARVQTITPLASTEMGLWPSVRSLAHESRKVVEDEFQYNSFHPSLNLRFDEASKDDRGTLYEAVIVRNQGEGAWVQPVFKIFTDVQETSLGDLFTQHPHDPKKWKHAGRSDDLLVFLDAMKFHPGFAERQITAHPGVAEVVIAGTRRPKASLIARLNDGADIDEVERFVEDVTKDYPFYARIDRGLILTVSEPFPKTAKGSIQKKATLDAYEKQLDALYETSS